MIHYQRYTKGLAWIVLAVLFSGCSKYLDKKPDNLLTEEQIWQTRINAEAYLHNIYSHVHTSDGDDWASIGASDESSVSIPTVNVRQMVNGNWNAQSWYFYTWGNFYAAIRKTFVFETNIDQVPLAELSDELKNQYKAEVRFLRGWFYWQLLRQYGPFVKLTSTIPMDADFNQYPRAPFDECVSFINELMDQAGGILPVEWPSTINYGRPTRGSCLGIKSQVALLAASPLWNGNNRFSGFTNADGTPLAPTAYDAEKWKLAADAARAVIQLNVYRLFKNTDQGDAAFDPYLSLRNLFLTTWNNEILFANTNWSVWGYTKCASPGPGGYNMYTATQNLVDAFAMNNGRNIDDPQSGYVENGLAAENATKSWGHRKGEWNMYANREPRFYAYVQYNGRPVLPAPSVDDKNYFSSDPNRDGAGRVEFYYNGKSGQKSAGSNNLTGYTALKRVNPTSNIRFDVAAYQGPYIVLRFAEILLNYAEALNEYEPGNAEVITYLNLVRERAGLPGIETVYPEAVGNKELMREHIIRERMVEFCFEGDRYYTLLRRLMMNNPEIKTIYGLNVGADDGGLGFSFTGFYNRTLFQNRFWDDRMYLFPIHQTDIERNRALVQNPGW
jgi:hypothetical protein